MKIIAIILTLVTFGTCTIQMHGPHDHLLLAFAAQTVDSNLAVHCVFPFFSTGQVWIPDLMLLKTTTQCKKYHFSDQ